MDCLQLLSPGLLAQVAEDRRRFLLSYVQKVDAEIMEQFAQHAPVQVVIFLHACTAPANASPHDCLQSPLALTSAPPHEQVVDAMRTSISNMLGVLPPHYFDVTVSTVGEHLAQLMFSVIMTGEAPPCLGPPDPLL